MMDDVDRIMLVMQAAFDPAFGEAWNRRQVLDALTMPGTYAVLAGIDGQQPAEQAEVAGFALLRRVVDEEELLLLAVHPDHRGCGIGGALLGRVIATAREHRSVRLFLEMRDGNPAETLYRRHGFMNIGRRRDYYRRGAAGSLDAITFGLDFDCRYRDN